MRDRASLHSWSEGTSALRSIAVVQMVRSSLSMPHLATCAAFLRWKELLGLAFAFNLSHCGSTYALTYQLQALRNKSQPCRSCSPCAPRSARRWPYAADNPAADAAWPQPPLSSYQSGSDTSQLRRPAALQPPHSPWPAARARRWPLQLQTRKLQPPHRQCTS